MRASTTVPTNSNSAIPAPSSARAKPSRRGRRNLVTQGAAGAPEDAHEHHEGKESRGITALEPHVLEMQPTVVGEHAPRDGVAEAAKHHQRELRRPHRLLRDPLLRSLGAAPSYRNLELTQ